MERCFFTADVHLGAGGRKATRKVEKRFVDWLDFAAENGATTIFLLGDIFDFWFEYYTAVPKGFVRTLGKLAELTDKGIKVVLFTGNHDMWTVGYLKNECGLEIYKKPKTMYIAGRKVFIAHGDAIGVRNPITIFMNWMFRCWVCQQLCRIFIPIGVMMRGGKIGSWCSRNIHIFYAVGKFFAKIWRFFITKIWGPFIARICKKQKNNIKRPRLIRYAYNKALKDKDIDDFIFGHIHLAQDYPSPELNLVGEPHVVTLGRWDVAENGEAYGSYAIMDDTGKITLKEYPKDTLPKDKSSN